MKLEYCCQCGAKLIKREIGDEGIASFCEKCSKYYFDNPKCCVLISIINNEVNGDNNINNINKTNDKKVLLLKQNYISTEKWTLCSGYVQHGETFEQAVSREVLEETGQIVIKSNYVKSYYREDKGIIMAGVVAFVQPCEFGVSKEVDDLRWFNYNDVDSIIAKDNNFSYEHLNACMDFINSKETNFYI